MEFYRTFIALPIEVGEEVRQILEILKRSLAGERISWVDPARFHLTLRFLGDTPLDQVRTIGERLQSDIRSSRISIGLTTLGSFGPRKRPRVLWIGFGHSVLLDRIYLETERILKKSGIGPAEQPFRAHLTLGRVRREVDLGNYYRTIESLKDWQLGTVEMDRLVYFRSIPGSAGPVYKPLYQVEFNE